MCVRVSSAVRPCSAKMSATICRWIFQIRKRSGSTVSMPSGPGGSASDADTSAALRAASRAIRSAACAASGAALDARRGHVGDHALDDAGRVARRRRRRLREGAFGASSGRVGGRAAQRRRGRQCEIIRLRRTRCRPGAEGRRRYNATSGSRRRTATGSHASMRIFGFAGWSGSGKTTLIEQLIPRLVAAGSRGLAGQARASPLRLRPAGQGFLPAPPGRLQRSAGHVGRALGADARAAGRARARAARRRSRGCRPATRAGRRLQGLSDSEARSLARRGRQAAAASAGSAASSASPPTARMRCRRGPSTRLPVLALVRF